MAARPLIKYVLLSVLLLAGCKSGQWNNPYRSQDTQADIIYTSFQERPKELDPVKSYNAAEYEFIAQIYEPPLQYHFLKRPYELVPLSARQLPTKTFYDQEGQRLAEDVDPSRVAYTDYLIEIQPDIRYQPHPSLAKDDSDKYRYHQLQVADLEDIYVLSDFKHQGSRTLTAYDYVYQIKRLAHPNLHSPLAGLLGNYIVGFSDYREKVLASLEQQPEQWLDLSNISMEGVVALDDYRYRIRVRGVYPQFIYWLSMPFFFPIP